MRDGDTAEPGRSGEDRGSARVDRRTVLGAAAGGIGAATIVGLTTAALWPDPETTVVTATGDGSSNGGTDGTDETTGATVDFAATPPEDFEARDPVLPPASAETEHRIDLRSTELLGDVAPGVSQMLWTFDDTVPGPCLLYTSRCV